MDVSRFVKFLEDNNKAYIDKCFTEEEIRYCDSSKVLKCRAERYAARFAAKEAVGKALGTGIFADGVGMHDIEVIKDSKGTPGVNLYGGALIRSQNLGISSVSISLSHDGGMAAAYCVMLSEN